MDFMLVIIAVAIFFLTIVMNGIVMIHFSDEQDKNQAWIPKLVVVRENAPVLCRAPLQCPAGQRRWRRLRWPRRASCGLTVTASPRSLRLADALGGLRWPARCPLAFHRRLTQNEQES